MRNRTLALLLGATLVFGGMAACGDDDDDDDDDGGTDTEQDDGGSTDEGDEGDEGGDESGNADVEAYCDAVEDFLSAVDERGVGDATLAQEFQELIDQSTALAANATDLTEEDSETLQECSAEAAEVFQGG